MSSPVNNSGPRPGTPVNHVQGSHNKRPQTPSSGVRKTTVVGEFEVGPEYGRARLQDRKVTEVTSVAKGHFSHKKITVQPSPQQEKPEQHVFVERTVKIKERTRFEARFESNDEPKVATTGSNGTANTEKKSSSSWLRFIGIAALVSGIALVVIGWHIANPLIMQVGAGTAVFGAGALLASFRKSGVQPDGALKV